MRRQGFTLIEVVFSLALIGVLTVATASWTTSALKLERSRSAADRIAHELDILDRSIRLDLVQFDTSTENNTPRISVEADTLSIRTRDHGPKQINYTFAAPAPSVSNSPSLHRTSGDLDNAAAFLSLGPGTFSIERDTESRIARITIEFTTPDARHSLIYHIPMRWIE